MFRHVVLFKWHPGSSQERIDALHEELRRLPERIPGVRGFVFGTDAGLFSDNYDIAVVADFDDEEGYLRYAKHAAHVDFVERVASPLLAQRAAMQFEIESSPTPEHGPF